ncbi:MAG: hypothetical protein KIT46_03925 [Anaerolineales bacterium]|nr:hypothetical protein [Anaerolineales bacterium]MCW5855175.1 hypothetical protein [Anaerolineales bacterium]
MKDLEQRLLDLATHHEEYLKEQLSNTEGTKQDWYSIIHEHYERELLPSLEENNEAFVEYWPCSFIWDETSQLRTYSTRSYRVLRGSYGTGYLAVSSFGLYICVFDKLSKDYPPVPSSLAYQVLSGVGGERDDRKRYKGDQIWRISFEEIHGTHAVDERILRVVTTTSEWKIARHFKGDLELIQTSISMGKNNLFRKNEALMADNTNREILATIEELAKLRESGAISNDDYESQKNKLLGRLK